MFLSFLRTLIDFNRHHLSKTLVPRDDAPKSSESDYQLYLKCLPPVDLTNNSASSVSLNPGFESGAGCSPDQRTIFEGPSGWIPETDKPYMCPSCGKGYTHVFTLNRHQRTVCGKIRNTSGKWKCPRCARRYTTEGNLARHLRFECGVRRMFCCIICNGKFTQRYSLIRHLRNIHNDTFDSTASAASAANAAIPQDYRHPEVDACDAEVYRPEDTAA